MLQDEPINTETQTREEAMHMASEFIHRLFLDLGTSSPEGYALKRALGFGSEHNQSEAARRLGCHREWLRKLERRCENKLHLSLKHGHRRTSH